MIVDILEKNRPLENKEFICEFKKKGPSSFKEEGLVHIMKMDIIIISST